MDGFAGTGNCFPAGLWPGAVNMEVWFWKVANGFGRIEDYAAWLERF